MDILMTQRIKKSRGVFPTLSFAQVSCPLSFDLAAIRTMFTTNQKEKGPCVTLYVCDIISIAHFARLPGGSAVFYMSSFCRTASAALILF